MSCYFKNYSSYCHTPSVNPFTFVGGIKMIHLKRRKTALKQRIEILAPGGDMDSIKSAIAAGASAVYCGIHKFNARNRADNISFDDLNGILRLAHSKDCEVFLTLNIIIVESEFPDLLRFLNKLVNTSIDGVIIQDLGLFYLLNKYFKGLKIHASTQLTTHNRGQIDFLHDLNATRVNLSRELDLEEIRALSTHAHQKGMLSEVFVHGSYCISFSGLCYMSSLHGGNSGNRGRCSQPCRDPYEKTASGKNFPLNLKDNSAFSDIKDLAEAGVDSLKIEGRIKKYHYVYTVVETYRKQLQRYYEGESMSLDNSVLYKVFNRDFSAGYLKGKIGKDMFIDNPRDHSATHRAGLDGGSGGSGGSDEEAIEKAERSLYEEKGGIRTEVKKQIDQMSVGHAPLSIIASGRAGSPLKLQLISPDSAFSVSSEKVLEEGSRLTLDRAEILLRFKAINDTEYYIENVDLKNLQPGLYIPFSEFSSMKKDILRVLRKGKSHISPVELPVLKGAEAAMQPPNLSILLSSKKDVQLFKGSDLNICFQLPDAPSYDLAGLQSIFLENRNITPWFPSILIGKEYDAAVDFLREVHPDQIVSDNTGIAHEAFRIGIPWIAGPRLNIVNSYGLLCLKEIFGCSGAYLSNEMKRQQISTIRKPEGFELYFSIYHPMDLMTSRQCLFQEVTGCSKENIDELCLPGCTKSASLTKAGKGDFFIEKAAANYTRLYNEKNYLNTEIVSELSGRFTGFLIDLRKIETKTRLEKELPDLVQLFEDLLKGKEGAAHKIRQVITATNLSQYKAGI